MFGATNQQLQGAMAIARAIGLGFTVGRTGLQRLAEAEQRQLKLRAVVRDLDRDRIQRLVRAQRPASEGAVMDWLIRRVARGEPLDGLPEATDDPPGATLAYDLATTTIYRLDQVQAVVDYVWLHPKLQAASRSSRLAFIRGAAKAAVYQDLWTTASALLSYV